MQRNVFNTLRDDHFPGFPHFRRWRLTATLTMCMCICIRLQPQEPTKSKSPAKVIIELVYVTLL